jgi:Tfp pilus assembly protein PilF
MLLLSLLLALVSCASNKDNELKIKQASLYFGAGTQALMERQYTEALANLLKANELQPENTEILTNLAMAYYFKGEKTEAITNLKQALKVDPKNSDAKVNLASMYFEDNRIAEAEGLYKEVLRNLTYDKQARTYYNLGLIELEKKNDSKAAEKYFRLSLKEDVNYCPSHLKLGMIQYDRRHFNQALATFREATMGTCFESPAPHYYQGLTLIELRRFEDARMKFEEISNRFHTDIFAVKARTKIVELKELEGNGHALQSQAPGKVLKSPEF